MTEHRLLLGRFLIMKSSRPSLYLETVNGNEITGVEIQLTAGGTIYDLGASVMDSGSLYLFWKADQSSTKEKQMFRVVMTPRTHPPINTSEKNIFIDKLQPSTKYVFEVNRQDECGVLVGSGANLTARTWDGEMENPTNANAQALNSTTIRLTWDTVKRSDRTTPLYTIVCLSDSSKLIQTTETTYNIANLAPFTKYAFNVY